MRIERSRTAMLMVPATARLADCLHTLDDGTLVQLAQAGDQAAQETLIRRFTALVRSRVRSYFLPGGDREDLRQEGLLGLVKAIRDYRPTHGCSFRSFAELCITRQVITALKTATRQKHAALNLSRSLDAPVGSEDDGRLLLEIVGTDDREQALLELRLDPRTELLEKARELLSPYEFAVLQLYATGLSYDEIGAKLGKTRKSVDSAVFKVKRKLRYHARSVA